MVYTILFLIGLIGLGAMLLLGGGHGGHAGHLGHAQGHAHSGQGRSQSGQGNENRSASLFWSLLSPLTLLSLSLGAGATGLLLQHSRWPATLTALAAALGAVAFYGLIVRPLMTLVFQFASKPSLALEGSTAKTAEAASKFDDTGRGVVKLNVDGQIVRVLAELDPDDRLHADLIKPGDSLTVTAVNGHTNTCTVARL